jgi:hypothetical protein
MKRLSRIVGSKKIRVDLHDILRVFDTLLDNNGNTFTFHLADQAELLIHKYHAHELTEEQFIEFASKLCEVTLLLDNKDAEPFKQTFVLYMNKAVSMVKASL